MENLRIEVSPNHPPRQGLVWERRVWSQQLGPKDSGPLHLQGIRPFMHHSCPNIRCLGLKLTWLQGSSFSSYFRSVHLLGHNSVKCECMMPFGIMQPWCYTKHLTKFSRLKRKNSAALLSHAVISEGRGNSAGGRERVGNPTWTRPPLYFGCHFLAASMSTSCLSREDLEARCHLLCNSDLLN